MYNGGFILGLFSLAAGLEPVLYFQVLPDDAAAHFFSVILNSLFLKPVLVTSGVFMAIYGLMVLKGYVSLVRSSVLDMLSGAKQKEMKPEPVALTAFKIILGVGVWGQGITARLRLVILTVPDMPWLRLSWSLPAPISCTEA
ncbi:MAG: hypothetical protein ACLRMZ_23145 [Blautia marasmi]